MADKNIRNIKMGLVPEFSSIFIIFGLFLSRNKMYFHGKSILIRGYFKDGSNYSIAKFFKCSELKGLPHELPCTVWLVLGLNRGRFMRVNVGLIMLTPYFFIPTISEVAYNCALMKVDWLAACIALGVVVPVLVVFL
jgi:hypothetical protein